METIEENIKTLCRVISSHKVTYKNGACQIRHLVSREDWEDIIKPIRKSLEIVKASSKRKLDEVGFLVEALNLMFINHEVCFPVGSPLFDSLSSGVLVLPPHQGGEHPVTWENI